MSGRQGGKLKPLKAKKGGGGAADEDEDDKAFKAKQKADAEAVKKAAAGLAAGGKLGAGMKKSGKK